MGASGRLKAGATRHAISIESQLLAIGAGFAVLVVLSALFVAIQQRRRRRLSRDSAMGSPLIPNLAVKPTFLKGEGRLSRQMGSPLQSPAGSGSSGSPQCTPLTPYASFNEQSVQLTANRVQPSAEELAQAQQDRGSISLALSYEPAGGVLQLSVLACHNLPNLSNAQGQCVLNPYVKLRVLPDNQHRVKTRVLRGTRNPFYDEQFTLYGIGAEQLDSFRLHLAVLGQDRYSRDTVLGEAFYALADSAGLLSGAGPEKQSVELPLRPRPSYADVHAQVLVSMAFSPHSNSVNFAVLKMKDLPASSGIGQIDAYAKVYLLLDGQRVCKQKTHVKKKNTEPVFNESFSFDVPAVSGSSGARLRSSAEMLETMSFEVLVLNHDGVTRNEIVGQCFIGPQHRHWDAMMQQPGQQVAEWHKINAL